MVNGSGVYNGYSHDSNIVITNENETGMTQYDDAIVSVTYTYYTDSARTQSVTAENVKNARKYYTRAVVNAGANYNVLTIDAEYDITPVNVTLQVAYTVTPDADNSIHYRGTYVGFTLSLNGIVAGESLTLGAVMSDGMTRGTGAEINRFTALNVGTYSVTITLQDNGSYLASNYLLTGGNTKTFVITPIVISADWSDLAGGSLQYDQLSGVAQFVYNRTLQGVKLAEFMYSTTNNILISTPGDFDAVTFDYDNASAIDVAVDEYRNAVSRHASVTGIRLNGELTDNYVLDATYEVNWIINKATLSGLSFANATYVYNTLAHSVAVSGSTTYGESAESLGFSYNIYTESASGAYVIIEGAPVAYDGSEPTHSGLTRYAKVVNSNSATNAGVYKIEVADITSNNYSLTSGETEGNTFAVATLTINKAAITGLSFIDLTVTYDGSEHLILVASEAEDGAYVIVDGEYVTYNAVTHVGLTRYTMTPTTQYGEAISVTYSISNADAAVVNAADRTHGAKNVLKIGNVVTGRLVTATIDAGNNYVVLEDESALTATLTITPVEVTVDWTDLGGVALEYSDGVAQFTYNMAEQGVLAVLSASNAIFTSEAPEAVYDTSAANLGNYATDVYLVDGTVTARTATIIGFTASGNDSDNYTLASGAQTTINWIIKRAYAYFVGAAQSGLFHLNDGAETYNGHGWYLNLASSTSADCVDAVALTDYSVSPSTYAYNEVSRTAPDVTATMSVSYYFTTDSTLAFNIADLTGWTLMDGGVVNANTYYVVAVLVDDNFETFVSEKATMTVTPYDVTEIHWGYDASYVYNGNDRGATVSAYFDHVGYVMDAEGTYKRVSSGTFESIVGEYTGTKYASANIGRVYLTDNLSFTQSGSEVSFLNAGNYVAVIDEEAYPDYSFTASTEHDLTIAPAPIWVTWSNSANWTGIYNKTAQGKTATINGLIGEEVLTFTWRFVTRTGERNGNASATTINFYEENAGVHLATVSSFSNYNGALASNYTWATLYVEDENGTYRLDDGVYSLIVGEYAGTRYSVNNYRDTDVTIAKKVIEVTWAWTNNGTSDTDFSAVVYNKKNYVLSVSFLTGAEGVDEEGKVCYGDTALVAFSYTDATAMLAGDYETFVECTNDNYTVDSDLAEKIWTIYPKTITVLSASLAKVYDGVATKALTVDDLVGVENEDVVTATMTYRVGDADTRHIGTHDANFTLDGADSANYVIEDVTAAAQISALNGSALVWDGLNVTYNGYEQSVSATIALLGDDRTAFAGGADSLTLFLTITKGGNASIYKNAGDYVITASKPAGVETAAAWTQLLADYGINAAALTTNSTIEKYSVEGITWTGDGSSYYYNNTDQSGSIIAGFTLLGTDTGTITPVIRKGGVLADFINAGTYVFTVDPEDLGDEPFWDNYDVSEVTDDSDLTRTIVMNKASLDNWIIFSGSDTWTYTDGTAQGYFVKQVTYTAAPNGAYVLLSGQYQLVTDLTKYAPDSDPEHEGGYVAAADGAYILVNGEHVLLSTYTRYDITSTFSSVEDTIYLPYEDPEVAIPFTYTGGDVTGHANYVKNAGSYTIGATFAGSNDPSSVYYNYEAWTNTVEVTVNRGVALFYFLDDRGANTIDVIYKGSSYSLHASPEMGDYYYIPSAGGKYVPWIVNDTVYYVDYTAITRYTDNTLTVVSEEGTGDYVNIADTAVLYSELEAGKYVPWTIDNVVYYVDYANVTRYTDSTLSETSPSGAYVNVGGTAVAYAELASASRKCIRMENYLNSRTLTYRDGTTAVVSYEISDGTMHYEQDANGAYILLGDEYVLISTLDKYDLVDQELGTYELAENGEYIIKSVNDTPGYYLLSEETRYAYNYVWQEGNSAKDVLKEGEVVGSYLVRAIVAQTGNYNAWTRIGYLRINPVDTNIVYMSAGVPVEVVDFEYCGVDQAPYLNAYITALGGDGTISTDGTGNKIWMNLAVKSALTYEESESGLYVLDGDEYVRYDAAAHSGETRYNVATTADSASFLAAGNYQFVAEWYTRERVILDSNETYANEYAKYINNYNVTNYYLDVTMRKRSAQISWFVDDEYTTLYDDTAFVYDGEAHSVYARGTTIQVAEQNNATGTNVYQNGTLVAYNSETHGTHIQLYTRSSNVYTLKELTAENGNYFFYSTNGTSFTAMTAERIASLTQSDDANVYYKDGDNYYRVNTLYVYNPIFRRFVAFAGDFGPSAENYGFEIQKYGDAHYDTIAITVNEDGTYESDATTQTNAGRYLSTIQAITGAGEGILQNYDVNASVLYLSWVISERVIDVTLQSSITKVYDGTTDMKGTRSVAYSAAAGTRTYTYNKNGATYVITMSNILSGDVTIDFLPEGNGYGFTVTANSKDVNVDGVQEGCTSATANLVFLHNTNYIYKVSIGDAAGSFANYETSFTVNANGAYVPDDRVARMDGDTLNPLHKFYRVYNENAHSAYVQRNDGAYVRAPHYVLLSSLTRYSNAACTMVDAEGEYVIFGGKKGVPYAIVAASEKYVYDNGTYALNNEEGTYVKYYTYDAYNAELHAGYTRYAINRYSTLGISFTGNIDATITPRPITVEWTYDNTLVYNGTEQEGATPAITNLVDEETVNMTLGYTGTANVEGAYDSATAPTGAGTYQTTITALDDPNYTTVGGTNVTSNLTWVIAKRGVTVDYNNFVQSWTQNDWVAVSVTDFELLGEDTDAIAALITSDELTNASFTVTLSDIATARTAAGSTMRNYTVNAAGSVIAITVNGNYEVTSDKKFTVSALSVEAENNDAYSFGVASLADLAVLATESAALVELDGVTSADVSYTQTANISGTRNGAFVIYTDAVVTSLSGNYVGTGYTLSDFTIIGSGERVGFFGEVEGTLTGVNLRYVSVLSTGANASVGAIAGSATEIASSTAQGHIYTTNTSTVGFLAGTTEGEVTDSAAVGYVKIYGSEAIDVTVGGAVGSASEDVEADTFVEINKINANAIVTAAGIVGEGEVTVSGDYLAGSLLGVDANAEGGVAYATYMAENETIRSMVIGYVMKSYYVGEIDTTEEGFEEYTIYSYRQLAIMEMYSWATYTLGADIYLPYSYGNAVHAGEFAYGTIGGVTGENAKKIYSSAAGTFMGVVEEVR